MSHVRANIHTGNYEVFKKTSGTFSLYNLFYVIFIQIYLL